ncbi:hypothetical protein ABVK25_000934 [Lepraria finkii]|uniref:ADP-ribosylation factor n=1 Tax=Lepraria finkii TaxID=1340010 RepID=A0ABR4BRB3_9LECA
MAAAARKPEMQDFDDAAVYKRYENAVKNPNSENFVIEFDSEKARAALDLDETKMQGFLEKERASTASTRWINIWSPDKQIPLIRRLSARYNFSPRLTGIMCSTHKTHIAVPPTFASRSLRQRVGMHSHAPEPKSMDARSSDIEMDINGASSPVSSHILDLSHYKMVNEVWHFFSVDWGTKYLCIGYNSLSDVEVGGGSDPNGGNAEALIPSENNPKGARTWTWLVLCDDGTVISMYENPFPSHQEDLDKNQMRRLLQIRRNLRNVLRQLSNVNNESRRKNPINTLDIRPGLSSNQTSDVTITDSPGLLFYYLFDDWYTSYALVAKEEHQYAGLLEDLRLDMFQKPHVEIVQQLHQYGRQLAVLKRMYQSYAMIIERILARQKPVSVSSGNPATMRNSGHHTRQLFQETNNTTRLREASVTEDTTAPNPTLGVPLPAAATVRFERLRDRINHYAISEIQECLDEKEALVFLNFNMITMKQSQAVERLTRITILLAKVTILFMPVSLMTGYFSTQIQDLQGIYTAKTYWICFAVIMALSFVFLLVFGVLSGTLEGKPIYRSLTETVLEVGNSRWKERKGKKRR